MPHSKALKVLLVDDHIMFTDGLKSILKLNNKIGEISNSKNGEEAFQLIQKEKFDLIITDIELPGMNGIQLTEKIKKINDNILVLVLSMHVSRGLVKEILRTEAEGYLLKKANKEELFGAIENVSNGGCHYGREITVIMADLISRTQNGAPMNKQEFTPRELEVLQLICKEYSTKEIADMLYIAPSTVETFRRSMFKKTNSRNVVGLIRYAVQNYLAPWH